MKIKSYLDLAGNPGKYPALDGLRAIAILLVLARHLVHYWPETLDVNPMTNLAYNGWLGVDLFFTLSGFLISHHLLTNWPTTNLEGYIKKFFVKRALRILPLYIAIILLVTLQLVPFYEPEEPIDHRVISYHVLFVQEYFYSTIIIPLWSLATEEKFYLISPIIIWICYKFEHLKIALVLAILIGLLFTYNHLAISQNEIHNYSYFFWQFRAPFSIAIKGLLAGTVIALLVSHNKETEMHQQLFKPLFYGAAVVMTFILFSTQWLENELWLATDWINLLFTICCSTLIYCCVCAKTINFRILHLRFLRQIAKLSYALYISHITIIPLTLHLTDSLTNFTLEQRFFTYSFLYLLLAWAFALILHYFIEKPFLIIKSKIK